MTPSGDAPGGDSGDGDDDGDPKLRSMRAVWLSMRDEDPPDRGMAQLLAAARLKADEMRPPSLAQRILAALRRPPALALATALVLVAGAVVIGRRTITESDALAPPTAAPVIAPLPGPSAGSAAPVITPLPEPAPPPAADRAREPAPADTLLPASPPAATASPARRQAPPAATPPPPAAAPRPRLPVERAVNEGRGAPARRADDLLDLGEPSKESREPAPPLGAVTRGGVPPGSLDALLHQCETAARRGDCVMARRLADRITRTDRDYAARLDRDASIARCLAEQAE